MGILTDDGQHEGWIGYLFGDGAIGGTSSATGVKTSYDANGDDRFELDDWRPYDEVIGWVGFCDCSGKPLAWRTKPWMRVLRPENASVADRRSYAGPLGHGVMSDAPDDIEEAFRAEWRAHVEPHLLLAELEELTRQQRALDDRIADVVAKMRFADLTWETIGRAAGITRQSAHERWKDRV
jgi:hypothetical protein